MNKKLLMIIAFVAFVGTFVPAVVANEKTAIKFLCTELHKDPSQVKPWTQVVDILCSELQDCSQYTGFCTDLQKTRSSSKLVIAATLNKHLHLLPEELKQCAKKLGVPGILARIK